jgi:uncharacterized protein YegP (UPF0339 family)
MQNERFEVYQSKDGWRWRLRAANSQIVATGEAHTRKADAIRACKRLTDIAIEAANSPLVVRDAG